MLTLAEKYASTLQNIRNRDINNIIEEILDDDDSNIVEKIFPHIITGNRWGKILFLKFLKEKKDKNILTFLRPFIEEEDFLINMLAIDVMTSIQVPGREEIFIELLKRPEREIKLIAINYLGLDRVKDSIYYLKHELKSQKNSEDIRERIKKALYRITGNFTYKDNGDSDE